MTDTDAGGETARVRPFADWLREQRGGRTHDELSTQLHDLVEAVADTGKAGSVTLTVSIKPMSAGDPNTLVVADKVTAKLPEHDRPTAVFFRTRDGNLSREDPRQLSFDSLREVPARTASDVQDVPARDHSDLKEAR